MTLPEVVTETGGEMDFELDDHGFSWVGTCKLPSWAGYLDRSGAYGGAGDRQHSDGTVEIVFAPEGRDASPLTPAERSSVQWLLDNQSDVSEAVKAAIFRQYPELQAIDGNPPAGTSPHMPPLTSPEDLKGLVGLYAINVHQISKAGSPYLGFEFGCTWDDDHGLGVLMHGLEVVEVGGSDTARLLWIAKRHAGEA